MTELELKSAILDSLKSPVMFCDLDHTIRYMNQPAIKHYKDGESLLGKSVLDCHNEKSQRQMVDILKRMQNDGLEEELIVETPKKRVWMRAVRDLNGMVVGYYERYEFR